MENIKELFELEPNASQKGVQYKNNLIKKNIVAYMAVNGECSISAISKYMNVSIPSVTKLVMELLADGIVSDNGKVMTEGGRRPTIYGLSSSAIFFVGAYVGFEGMCLLLIDLHGDIVETKNINDFVLENTQESLDLACENINGFIDSLSIERGKIVGLAVSMVGRTNSSLGVNYNYSTFLKKPLLEYVENKVGIKTIVENDVRSKCYAEFFTREQTPQNAIYFEFGMGIAVGVIVNGELCYGKSGFAGEFGHIPFCDNNILCHCGKKGCLETEISGKAIERKLTERLASGSSSKLEEIYKSDGKVGINDIIDAALEDDSLAIETLIEVSGSVGRSLTYLINLFNPELVVIGGCVARAGDYILLPIKSAVSKYTLKFVAGDTDIQLTNADTKSSALGAAMLVRKHILGV